MARGATKRERSQYTVSQFKVMISYSCHEDGQDLEEKHETVFVARDPEQAVITGGFIFLVGALRRPAVPTAQDMAWAKSVAEELKLR